MRETIEELKVLLNEAAASIKEAAKTADTDEKRPVIHFHSPAQWMDDPNGILFHDGYYHMMYSLNPNSSKHRAGMVYKTKHRVWDPDHPDWTGGITVWGHARSLDLLHWEHLPVALYPSIEQGEHFIWFGTTAVNDCGVPVAIYTSVGPEKRPEDTADQWMAYGDQEMIHWEPVKENPVLSYEAHRGEVLTEWRDPFIVKDDGRTYLILGAKLTKDEGSDGVIALYEAGNRDYTSWEYKGILFKHPNKAVPSIECPNLVKIGSKWVVLLSPHGAVEYYTGTVDFENCTFEVDTQGIVDYSTNFYATNVLKDGNGRLLMWGALEGFQNTKGWNGCVSLPRELSVGEKGELIQKPAAELEQLRTRCWHITAAGGEKAGSESGTFEIRTVLSADGGQRIVLEGGEEKVTIGWNGHALEAVGRIFEIGAVSGPVEMTVYGDRTVLECYLGTGACVSIVLGEAIGDCCIRLEAETGNDMEGDVYQLAAEELFDSSRFV